MKNQLLYKCPPVLTIDLEDGTKIVGSFEGYTYSVNDMFGLEFTEQERCTMLPQYNGQASITVQTHFIGMVKLDALHITGLATEKARAVNIETHNVYAVVSALKELLSDYEDKET